VTAKKVRILGIGYRPLDERSRKELLACDVILASDRLFEVFKGYGEFPEVAGKVRRINKVEETLEFIDRNREELTIVLLGSGDPMFHGIGRRVITRYGSKEVEIIPDLSAIQVAFSRIGETWDDAFLMSLHGGLIPGKGVKTYTLDDLPALLAAHRKIAILTDGKNNPTAIARTFCAIPGHPPMKIFVCEKLGYGLAETVTAGTPGEIARKTYADPNVVVLLMDRPEAGRPGLPPEAGMPSSDSVLCFGLTEEEIIHSRGLITKDEVRAVTLHRLRLPEKGVLWDIGAGSGSVSIEAARLSSGLKVYAIDRDEEQASHVESNKERFNASNIEIVRGEAPDVLGVLPGPDRVCIGGSRGRLSAIIDVVSRRMNRGIVVINAVTLETVNEAIGLLDTNGFRVEASQISVSRLKELGGRRHMAALNPVFVISGEKI
jgi:precorrin-6B C5,15-methyltransferase / cobalt-precorrin-6B C5,C15-methyltransferase